MLLFFSAGAVLLSVIVTALALRAAQVAHARLATAHLELIELRARTTRAEADVEAAIERVSDLHQLRVDDVQRMRDDVRELRENYERVLHRYQTKHAIDGPAGRVH